MRLHDDNTDGMFNFNESLWKCVGGFQSRSRVLFFVSCQSSNMMRMIAKKFLCAKAHDEKCHYDLERSNVMTFQFKVRIDTKINVISSHVL